MLYRAKVTEWAEQCKAWYPQFGYVSDDDDTYIEVPDKTMAGNFEIINDMVKGLRRRDPRYE